MDERTLLIKDAQTANVLQIHVTKNSLAAKDFSKFKTKSTLPITLAEQVPIRLYDPGFVNTAVCKSKVSFRDKISGKLYYRGYSVDELVQRSTYLEVAYLLLYGELPNEDDYQTWVHNIMHHTFIHVELGLQWFLTIRESNVFFPIRRSSYAYAYLHNSFTFYFSS